MFIIERIIGISIYFISLLIIIYLIKSTKKVNKYLNIYIIILCIMAFLYEPESGSDLFRINQMLVELRTYDFKHILNYISHTSTPVSYFYFWIFSKIGIPGLLSMVTTLIFFVNIFYIIKDYNLRNSNNVNSVIFALFFLMSTGFFMELIANIRDLLAYSILARCFYDETFKQKSIFKTIFWYFICIFIHQSTLLIIAIRFFTFVVFDKKSSFTFKLSLFLLTVLFLIVKKDYVIMALKKYLLYIQNDTYFYIWEYFKCILIMFVFVFLLFNMKKQNIKITLPLIFFITNIFNVIEYNLFLRITYFIVILLLPYLLKLLNTKNSRNLRKTLLLASIVLIILSLTRGDLSSLKFFRIN